MKKLFASIKEFFHNLGGWFKGFWIVYIAPKDTVFSFYGYGHFGLSVKYANKRRERNGQRHWCIPAGRGAEQLIVINTAERKKLQYMGLMNKAVTINTLLNSAYYYTEAGARDPKSSKKK